MVERDYETATEGCQRRRENRAISALIRRP
jgi:hypothetical protein